MKTVFTILLLLPTFIQLRAQVEQPQRFEIIQKYLDEEFTVISLEREGLALFRGTNQYKDRMRSWQVMLLDTTLNIKVDTLVNIEREYNIIGFEYTTGILSLLFQSGEFIKDKIALCDIELKDSNINIYNIKTEVELKLSFFSRLQQSILFAGYINNEPAIVMYDLVKGKAQMVPGFLQRNTELLDMRVNLNATFNVVMVEKMSGENKRIIFRTYDAHATLLLEDIIESEASYTIFNAISSNLYRDDLLLIGTWGTRSSDRALGFYTTLVNPFEEQKTKLVQFGSLQHYLDYLKPRRADKIKTKTKAAILEGKLFEYTNNSLPYKIVEHQNGFIVLAETYATGTNNSDFYNNRNYTQPWNSPYYYYNPYYPRFGSSRPYQSLSYGQNVAQEDIEIKTYSSSLLFINAKGIIENDFSAKLEDFKISGIKQISDVAYFNDSAIVVYRKKHDILFHKVDLLDSKSKNGNVKIKLNDDFDDLRTDDDQDAGIKCWYNNVFYTWGYHSIKNTNIKGNKTREVFYINKVVVH
ncbi:hypothetical protein SanaruYs_36140 [Chryseotalea sanaruensis]|uniref:Uncharacterized protein n=1 Tax=Chryseotalea sanaruensis TaxID=2482724 RepID=A0A401UEN3_9BACT|nr:hypothetical protein [Chryseotalea sanaruensis]GCC53371.1 hypothetical protein SanaruYs_36140 [Chryseotalea sanaruensis]